MLSEAINTFRRIVDEAKSVELLQVDPNDPRTTYIRRADGIVETIDRLPPARKHTLGTLDSLEAAIERYGTPRSTLWVAFEKVVVVLDDTPDDHRLERLTLPLLASEAFRLLGDGPKNQKAFVTWLRQQVEPIADLDPTGVRQLVSELRFSTTDDLSGSVQADATRLGREVQQRVTAADRIPERINVEFAPYPGLDEELGEFRVTVSCSLNVDLDNRTLHLRPDEGQIEAAKLEAMGAVRTWIAGSSITQLVLVGTP